MRRKDSTRWRPEPDSPSRTLSRHPTNLPRGLCTSTSPDPCKFGNAKNTKNTQIPDTRAGCLVAFFLQSHQRCANSEKIQTCKTISKEIWTMLENFRIPKGDTEKKSSKTLQKLSFIIQSSYFKNIGELQIPQGLEFSPNSPRKSFYLYLACTSSKCNLFVRRFSFFLSMNYFNVYL